VDPQGKLQIKKKFSALSTGEHFGNEDGTTVLKHIIHSNCMHDTIVQF
jgi:hypothetical protein